MWIIPLLVAILTNPLLLAGNPLVLSGLTRLSVAHHSSYLCCFSFFFIFAGDPLLPVGEIARPLTTILFVNPNVKWVADRCVSFSDLLTNYLLLFQMFLNVFYYEKLLY